ncbi:MAG: LytTR family DNA-binding domain-containing protein [Bacteroidota bacterium]|nr:LytTR family DNA-binding domain-containing protein [Bacteroidota bacterium]
MKINCIIIDDEPLACKGLEEYINEIDFLHLQGIYDSALKAMNISMAHTIDLIFLDIEMPGLSGMDFYQSLQHPPQVIFTTAYPQYALQGFNVNALDYLVKPISFDRFVKAALKAKEYFEIRAGNSAKAAAEADFFYVKANNKIEKILLEDICYAEALQNYICIYTKEKKYITYLTFKSLEEYLPPDKFLKIHKSFIIAISKVDSLEAGHVNVLGKSLPVSRNIKTEVMEKLLQNRFLKR